MSDRLTSHLRTYWPLLLGHLTALITGWAAARMGWQLDSVVVYELLAVGLSGAIYAVGRALEDSARPWLRTVARWLLSLGLPTGKPTYPAQSAPDRR